MRKCQKFGSLKPYRNSRYRIFTKPENFTIPQGRFDHIHIDLVGPLPPSENKTYLFTIVDRFTRWPECYLLSDITATTIAKVFVEEYVSRFGCPLRITTDRCRQFTSRLFDELTKLLGTHHITTTAYHPRANGMVERFHRQFKEAFKVCHESPKWTLRIPLILFKAGGHCPYSLL